MHKTKRVAVVLAMMGSACAARAVKSEKPLVETIPATFVVPVPTKKVVEVKSSKKEARNKRELRPINQILADFEHNGRRFDAMYELLDHDISGLDGRDADRVRDITLKMMKIDSEVLVPGIRILGEIADPSTVYEIGKLSTNAYTKVRHQAAKSLGNIKSQDSVMLLIYLMADSDIHVNWAASDSLIKMGPFAAPHVAPHLTSHGLDGYAAVQVLSGIGPEAVDDVVPYLYHKDKVAVYNAITALGNIGDKSALKDLHAVLSHPDNNVRGTAANALRKIGDKSSIEPLSKLAKKDPSDFVRAAAMHAVKELSQ